MDYVLMFKILILQRYNKLSEDAMEYQMLDRLSFQRFLGLENGTVPDAKTIWLYRERLSESQKEMNSSNILENFWKAKA
jgi:IS5 family transposase